MVHELRGAQVTVMGLGRFGGGAGVTRWLASQGAEVLVTDLSPPERLGAAIDLLAPLLGTGQVRLKLGGHPDEAFRGRDLLVVNPAVPRPWTNPYIAAARRDGVPITTEIRLLTERIDRRRVIGVTGTAGKSTTAAMIHHLLDRATGGRSHLGGNIGGSLLTEMERIGPDDWIVLELSSAMLYWLNTGGRPFAPHVAVLTNLSPNHLDWHGTMEHYRQCKLAIFAGQGPGDHAISGLESEPRESPIPLLLPGEHNQANARLAMAAARRVVDLPAGAAGSLLANFAGLPHRLQLIGRRHGVRYVNDSKSTTPAATRLAVAAFEDSHRVHLIAGGHDKKVDLAPIALLAPKLGGLYTIGVTGPVIAELTPPGAPVAYCRTLDRAVAEARRRAREGDVVLLSPGCASWDQFDHFEARGREFGRLVEEESD